MNFMTNPVLRLLMSGSLCLTTLFVGNSIGEEGRAIMTEGQNLLLFALLIIGLIILFRLYCFRLNRKSRFLLVCMYLSIFFLVSLFGYFLRIYFLYHFSLYFCEAFPFF